jgi:hypothetical protein
MKPSQNFFCGALALNEPQSRRYHSPSPGWRIEYHIAASVDLPLQQCAAAAKLAVGASSSAQMPSPMMSDRMSSSSEFAL